MESSEEDDDFSAHEWITPQSSVNSVYQSHTEKGIRKICSELLELKDAVENLCGNMQSKYLAFLRISEEVIEVEQELIELQKHVSAQGILVQDLMSGVCRELEMWNKSNSDELAVQSELDNHLNGDMEDPKVTFLETVDILLAEHKTEEALLVLDAEEKSSPELKDLGDDSTAAVSAFKAAFLKRKAMLVEQLVMICEQPSFCLPELKKALSGLTKLGKGSLAQQLLLKAYGSRLQKSIESFLPLCTIYSETYAASLSKLVFSTISLATKESTLLFGDMPSYTNRIVQWAEFEIESFVRLVKENSPSPETICALRAASVCIQASLSHCSLLESQGLKFSKLLMVLLRPHVEEILDLNFRRSRRRVLDLARDDDVLLPSAQVGSSHFVASPSNIILTSSGKKFMSIVKDILDQLTPLAVIHFGGTILNKILQVFDRYIETLIKALPGPSEDDSLMESKDSLNFRLKQMLSKLHS
uniref:Exocyst component Exo84 C-terminal domain-containing protein n=1 Tax=Ananas comosus var. bracteatus TaxID=296719 RepID=A0A6V7QC94_ANACO|nr:unnamed protein product [Ananas comosus var. bracteatus]